VPPAAGKKRAAKKTAQVDVEDAPSWGEGALIAKQQDSLGRIDPSQKESSMRARAAIDPNQSAIFRSWL
jgi:hypothetical protein